MCSISTQTETPTSSEAESQTCVNSKTFRSVQVQTESFLACETDAPVSSVPVDLLSQLLQDNRDLRLELISLKETLKNDISDIKDLIVNNYVASNVECDARQANGPSEEAYDIPSSPADCNFYTPQKLASPNIVTPNEPALGFSID